MPEAERVHQVAELFDSTLAAGFRPRTGYVHGSKEEALRCAAIRARGNGAPGGARVVFDYDIIDAVNRVVITWHTPENSPQPRDVKNAECIRLQAVPE